MGDTIINPKDFQISSDTGLQSYKIGVNLGLLDDKTFVQNSVKNLLQAAGNKKQINTGSLVDKATIINLHNLQLGYYHGTQIKNLMNEKNISRKDAESYYYKNLQYKDPSVVIEKGIWWLDLSGQIQSAHGKGNKETFSVLITPDKMQKAMDAFRNFAGVSQIAATTNSNNKTFELGGAKITLANVGTATNQFINGAVKRETKPLIEAMNPYSDDGNLTESVLRALLVVNRVTPLDKTRQSTLEKIRKNVTEIYNQGMGAKFNDYLRQQNNLSSGSSAAANNKVNFDIAFKTFVANYPLLQYNGPGKPITWVRADDNTKAFGKNSLAETEVMQLAKTMAKNDYFEEASFNNNKIPVTFDPKDPLGLKPSLFSTNYAQPTPGSNWGHAYTTDLFDKNNWVVTSFMYGFMQAHYNPGSYQIGLKNIHSINDATNFMLPGLVGNFKISQGDLNKALKIGENSGAAKNWLTFLGSKIIGLVLDTAIVSTKGEQGAFLNNALLGYATYTLLNKNALFMKASPKDKIAISQAVLSYVINNRQAASADLFGGLQMQRTGTAIGNQSYPDPVKFPEAAMYYALMVHKKFQNEYLNAGIFVSPEDPLYGFILNSGGPSTNNEIVKKKYTGTTPPNVALIPPGYLESNPLYNKATQSFNYPPYNNIKFPSNKEAISTDKTQQAQKKQQAVLTP